MPLNFNKVEFLQRKISVVDFISLSSNERTKVDVLDLSNDKLCELGTDQFAMLCEKLGECEKLQFLKVSGCNIGILRIEKVAHFCSNLLKCKKLELFQLEKEDLQKLLIHFAREGYLELVNFLLNKAQGATIDVEMDGRTLFSAAAAGGHLEIIKYLLERGIDINERRGEMSPLEAAMSNEHFKVIEFLVERGIQVKVGEMEVYLNLFNDLLLNFDDEGENVAERDQILALVLHILKCMVRQGAGLLNNFCAQITSPELNRVWFGNKDLNSMEILYFCNENWITTIEELKALTFKDKRQLMYNVDIDNDLIPEVRNLIYAAALQARFITLQERYFFVLTELERERADNKVILPDAKKDNDDLFLVGFNIFRNLPPEIRLPIITRIAKANLQATRPDRYLIGRS